ncbi:ABC transporter permease [Actinoplanes subglobosus]|uniref:Transport permease protein n=1 Tax=Actinoplanes subglobosus TaxID=1547892 RepID=A0ABV8IPS9_9ACTN
MNAARILFVGGLMSYRALFTWLRPWILIPSFIVSPLFQILFFAYLGRTAGIADDMFFIIGNAIQYAALPCLFAMGSTINGERQEATLELLLASPAPRVPLFLGRALPVILNGFCVSIFAIAAGSALLGVRIPGDAVGPLALAVGVSAFSCTGLGMFTAALALRIRETAVLGNILFGVLLIFAGVNVPLELLPEWMSSISAWLPLTHGIEAARHLAAGAPLGEIGGDLLVEAGIGLLYLAVGLVTLALLERSSRRAATLDRH